MQGMTRRTLIAAITLALLPLAGSCGEEKGGGEVTASDALTSSREDEFKVVEEDGRSYVVGHGIVVAMADGWSDFASERVGLDGSTWEWAIGDSTSKTTLVQFSMAIPTKGGKLASGLDTAAEKIAERSREYRFIDKGDVDVPGTDLAKFLRFEREVEFKDGAAEMVEQVTLMIEIDEETTSTLRFIAPQGEWDETMKDAYESVEVTAS